MSGRSAGGGTNIEAQTMALEGSQVVYNSGVLCHICCLSLTGPILGGERQPQDRGANASLSSVSGQRDGGSPAVTLPIGGRCLVLERGECEGGCVHDRPNTRDGLTNLPFSNTRPSGCSLCSAGQPLRCRARKPGTRWLRTVSGPGGDGRKQCRLKRMLYWKHYDDDEPRQRRRCAAGGGVIMVN